MKLNKINSIIFLAIISLFSISTIASAEVSTTSKIKEKLEKPFEKNRDIRNTEIKNQKASTTAKIKEIRDEKRLEIKDIRASSTQLMKEKREEIKDIRASSTAMFKEMRNEKRIATKNMQLKAFEIRKNALVNELNKALKNIDNIDSRIKSRIASSTIEGKDMTIANTALVIAESKLAAAKISVNTFAALSYASSTTITGTTTNITLDRPRIAGDSAIKAVKDARDSFKIVVDTIAHIMGVKINATSTIPTSTTI